MIAFRRLSLTHQFLVASFPIVLIGMLVIGLWVAREIEQGVVNRLGSVTSLYVDSLVAPHLQHLIQADTLDARHRQALDTLFTDTPLGQKIVAFNIWRPDGRVLYSTEPAVIGQTFPVGEGLATALRGDVYSKRIERSEMLHASVGSDWPPRLIETYTPVHAETLGKVLGAAEFYQTTDELMHETNAAERRSWLVVASTMAGMYLLLFGLVRRGSQTIAHQERELQDRVAELSTLLERNAQLDARVRGAAARTTALNERFLRRIAADLHDGPGQDLGFALMRFEAIASRYRQSSADLGTPDTLQEDFQAVRSGLESALGDLRSISAGLLLPEINDLSTNEIAGRAVRDYERKTGVKVTLVTAGRSCRSLPPRQDHAVSIAAGIVGQRIAARRRYRSTRRAFPWRRPTDRRGPRRRSRFRREQGHPRRPRRPGRNARACPGAGRLLRTASGARTRHPHQGNPAHAGAGSGR